MPDLDRLLIPPPREQDQQLLEGELVYRGSLAYLRVNGDAALWGPLRAADGLPAGTEALVGISHTGTYWVIAHG